MSIFDTLSWLQSLYNVNKQLLSLLDVYSLDEQTVKESTALLNEIIDIIEQLDNKQILVFDLHQLQYFATITHHAFRQALMENDFSVNVIPNEMIDKLKNIISVVNDKIQKLIMQVENTIAQTSTTEGINLTTLETEQTFIQVYNDFKKWYADGAVVDEFLNYEPEQFEDAVVATKYDDVLRTLHKYKDFLVDFINKFNLQLFADAMKDVQNMANNVFTANELVDYYRDLILSTEEELPEFAESYVSEHFYLMLYSLIYYGNAINDLMTDVYMFISGKWKK
jgi:hypothetical protein